MRILSVLFFVDSSFAGCPSPTICAELDQQDPPPQNLDLSPCPEAYRLVLETESADYRNVQALENTMTGAKGSPFLLVRPLPSISIKRRRLTQEKLSPGTFIPQPLALNRPEED